MTLRGVYVGNSPTALQQFENWLGSEIETVHGVVGMANWSDFTNSANWMTNTLWKGINERVHWSVPIMVTDGSASLAQAARGAYDSYYATVAKTLLASRAGDNDPIHVRTGWEANGEWFKWTAVGHEQEFIGAFRHFADTFHNISSRFKIEWNINYADTGINPATIYPGDSHVDVIGMDFYWTPEYQGWDPNNAFNGLKNARYGLQWLEDFAAQHGKPTSYSEWGINSDNAGPYIQKVKEWFQTHNVALESYWDVTMDKVTGLSTTNSMPNASAAFKAAFSTPLNGVSSGGTTTAPSAPTPVTVTTGDTKTSAAPGNTVWGGSGNDALTGTDGNNAFSSGSGNDWMAGGRGDDTYLDLNLGDQAYEKAGEGVDTITTWLDRFTLPDNVENLTITGTSWTTATGNGLSNIIIGNGSANIIDGRGGNDLLTGGGGRDTFVITKGMGHDTITDFRPQAWGGDADKLSFKGFGNGAKMTNIGNEFTIVSSDGSVDHFTLKGINSISSSDYAFS
ncbi:glycosyl hydrolase [Muricoccus pecuniae]|uniref:GH26 domain-containing protein n=1 Tax=Muricoccus pecuniae TaxID=693023 RepID=A0A840XXR7_9PROT|nr:glycosyl hydrolase [Roseomonas pecuniae]MBB5692020.1 hypothetical protein [Roseomonas pecuniae]